MTVRSLIAKLQEVNPDAEVVVYRTPSTFETRDDEDFPVVGVDQYEDAVALVPGTRA